MLNPDCHTEFFLFCPLLGLELLGALADACAAETVLLVLTSAVRTICCSCIECWEGSIIL